MPKKAFLIDGNSFCYRAYFAIRSLTNSKGFPTNAIYGFVTMLRKLKEKENPDYLAVAFDTGAPTFRHKAYEEYKIQRTPMPDDMFVQLSRIKEVIQGYRIPIFEKDGYEADDVLATLAKRLAGEGVEVFIVTGDKDALQLVNSRIKVYNTSKDGVIYDAAKVRERYGVGPEKMTDIMGLMGDSIDNIPGIPGFGEKTAVELISRFGSLEKVLTSGEALKSEKQRRLITEFGEQARMSKELAALDTEVPIEVDVKEMDTRITPDTERLKLLFREFEFSSLLKELLPAPEESQKGSLYQLVEGAEALDGFIERLKKQRLISVDTETTSEDPMRAELVGLSFSWKEKEAYYIPVAAKDRREEGGKRREEREQDFITSRNKERSHDVNEVLRRLKPVLEDPRVEKIGQNIKYDWVVLKRYGVDMTPLAFDTMVASYLLNPSKLNHNLGQIALDVLGVTMTPTSDLIGKGKTQGTMDAVEIERVSDYACADADIVFRLKSRLEEALEDKELLKLFHDVEMPLVRVLGSMEMAGVAIDTKQLKILSKKMESSLTELTGQIYETAGTEFNINSPLQLRKVLFEDLKLPVIKRTKTGPSTDVEVLERLADKHPLPKLLVTYRENSKLKSTYVDALPLMLNPETERVHTSFNQTVTATGRLSSSDPNLQNIPIRTALGREIRRAFVAGGAGEVLVKADYSQIELRVLAHLSGDEALTKAFVKGLDVHAHTASLVYGIPEKEVTAGMRSSAKTVNFGIIYGLSAFGLARTLGIDQEEAQTFIEAYFKRYPGVRDYMDRQIDSARKYGCVTTLFHRRRYIPEITSAQVNIRNFAERTAINTPVQGSAADLIKVAMLRIHEALQEEGLKARMILQVHDELVFETPKALVPALTRLVKDKMENAIRLDVPLVAQIKTGQNWLEVE
ncbi:MAG: DNA polymerase I [Candidatus Omnitrophica bacterium]|nr:DNA polymerase I [Candidatus Omnitrophota bacterium]